MTVRIINVDDKNDLALILLFIFAEELKLYEY